MTAVEIPASAVSYDRNIVAPLLADPVLGRCSYESLARILPHLGERSYQAGETLFAAGDKADALVILRQGSVDLERANTGTFESKQSLCGEECALGLDTYLGSAVARTPVTALVLPRATAVALVAANPGLRADLFRGLALPGVVGDRPAARKQAAGSVRENGMHAVGWLATLCVPAAILWFAPAMSVGQNTALFLAVFAATICMWVFSLVDEFVPGIFAIFAILVLGVAPPSAVLSGFASDGFFLAMSILGLSTVIVASGLSYRFLLWLLLKLPNREGWQNLGLLLTGFLLTPMVPSINGRVALLAPLTIDMAEILHARRRGKASTGLAISAFTGASLLSAVFMSSKSVNFVIYGLLPAQAQTQFQWLFWLFAAAATGVAMLLFHWALAALFLRHEEQLVLSKDQVAAQLRLLGPMRTREWAAVAGVGLFMLGVVTASLHKIQPPWVALAILYVLLVFGFLRKEEFRDKIDWPFLVYLAGIVGLVGAFNAVGLQNWLAVQLAPLGSLMQKSFPLFIAALAAIIFVIRLAVPISTTIVIVAAVMMPLASAYGINAWIVGFIVLMLGEMWFFPYQCSYYVQLRDLLGKSEVYDERRFLAFNLASNVGKLVALYISLPYWKALGLL